MEFSLGARMPSLLHAGSLRKLTESLPTSPSSLLAAKPKERVLKNQKSFSDEHGRSVSGKTNMELQKELGSWKAEDFVTNKVELPTHLTVGTRIEHTDRGLGTVVNLRSVFPPMVFVEYDAGDIHGQEPGLIYEPPWPVAPYQSRHGLHRLLPLPACRAGRVGQWPSDWCRKAVPQRQASCQSDRCGTNSMRLL